MMHNSYMFNNIYTQDREIPVSHLWYTTVIVFKMTYSQDSDIGVSYL